MVARIGILSPSTSADSGLHGQVGAGPRWDQSTQCDSWRVSLVCRYVQGVPLTSPVTGYSSRTRLDSDSKRVTSGRNPFIYEHPSTAAIL